MLVDTRPDRPPDPPPRPPREPIRINWRLWAVLAAALALLLLAPTVGGVAGYVMVLVGVTLACRQVNRTIDGWGYVGGLSDHRQ